MSEKKKLGAGVKRYIHIAVMLAITLGIGFLCPTFGQVTRFGMRVLGVFVGVLYGWIAFDLIFSSIFGYVMLAAIGIMPAADALVTGFGNSNLVVVMAAMVFNGALDACGVTTAIANFLVSRKMFRKNPWLLVIGLIYNYAKKKNLDAIMGPLKAIDLETLGLLVGLFLMIGGISNMGVIDALAQLLAKLGAGNPFLMYTIIVWASVLISAFIDNIPYVATMIPVIAGIAMEMGIDSTALYFGLLSGATLGGNCTPIGASANITGIGILRKEGHEVSNGDFFKIGIPFTLSAIVPAYILIWILFGA